jgi:cyclopropane-fatty-acyl-phospholipid synthase
MNFNSIENSRKNIHKHYDLSNELYKRFLDKSMTYSSAFFKDLSPTQENLYLAQQNKYSRITQKLGIDFSKNPHILEIGCGWGGYAQSLVRDSCNKYFSYTGITISEEQYAYCIELFQNDSRISIVLIDYRLIRGTFDYVVSIEMIEAVGIQYMDTYFKTIYNRLNKNGKAMIQAITIPDHRYETYKKDVDFIQKYIFPGAICPCIKDIVKNSSQNSLILVDMNHFGFDYKHTLLLWLEKFTQHFHEIREFGFDEYFYLTWKYYFIYCAVGFHNKIINVNQMMFQKY